MSLSYIWAAGATELAFEVAIETKRMETRRHVLSSSLTFPMKDFRTLRAFSLLALLVEGKVRVFSFAIGCSELKMVATVE